MHLPPLLRESARGAASTRRRNPAFCTSGRGARWWMVTEARRRSAASSRPPSPSEKPELPAAARSGLVNTDPLYMLGYVVDRIAQAGLVGIALSAGRPRVHPPGGIDPILGTNPVAIALPTETDTTARGRLRDEQPGVWRPRAGAATGRAPACRRGDRPGRATDARSGCCGGGRAQRLWRAQGVRAGPLRGAPGRAARRRGRRRGAGPTRPAGPPDESRSPPVGRGPRVLRRAGRVPPRGQRAPA